LNTIKEKMMVCIGKAVKKTIFYSELEKTISTHKAKITKNVGLSPEVPYKKRERDRPS